VTEPQRLSGPLRVPVPPWPRLLRESGGVPRSVGRAAPAHMVLPRVLGLAGGLTFQVGQCPTLLPCARRFCRGFCSDLCPSALQCGEEQLGSPSLQPPEQPECMIERSAAAASAHAVCHHPALTCAARCWPSLRAAQALGTGVEAESDWAHWCSVSALACHIARQVHDILRTAAHLPANACHGVRFG